RTTSSLRTGAPRPAVAPAWKSCGRSSSSRSRRRPSCARSSTPSKSRADRRRVNMRRKMTPEQRLVRPKIKPLRLLLSWPVAAAAALFMAAEIVPHVEVKTFLGAVVVSLVIAILNAAILPLIAAIRLPFTLVLGFLIVLILDALMLLAASAITDSAIEVSSFWWALLTALIASAVTVVLDVLFGTNDDDTYTLRVIERIARRSGERVETEVPGIVFLEIDGLALPILQRAMRDGNAPTMARWLADGSHRFVEWEPDLSSQTGASQAGILLGSNE